MFYVLSLVILTFTLIGSSVSADEKIYIPSFKNTVVGVSNNIIQEKSKEKWRYINNNWYYFDESETMKIGWVYDNEKWYYLNPNQEQDLGVMQTGWINDNGTWYYLLESGAMQVS
ncbi:hypothetical protein FDC58_14985 [Clostridium botulinum]|uniref:Choline binding protein A n=1 Tax=Clostridium botulinum TaxID=1491 RepID=A0A0A0UZQ0_CLOBO|nr:hypothetical protein [Clostridium botulinum]AIW54607.1 Choline binding protein A [Clostridium botulinum]AIW54760.1 hypothetical protein [Clostridium botulinum]AIW54856.1 Choline binding protein A [Clostridium botulinum]MBY7009328.1 hypothetical protein [Clostridium botulinum]NFH74446.1 hypothetical protein [Clostridium botulinum]